MSFMLKNQGVTTLTHTWYLNGTATDIGAVTVTITRADGTAVVTGAATTNNADGTYNYDLANQAAVDNLTVVWTASNSSYGSHTDYIEVVGNLLFTEAQLRAWDNGAMADTTTYTDADILDEQVRIADMLENLTGRSWIRRYRRMRFAAAGGRSLYLPDAVISEGGSGGEGARFDTRELLSASVAGSSVTVGNVEVDAIRGVLYRKDGWWGTSRTDTDPFPITVEVEYGAPALIDGVDRIAMMLARYHLVPDPTDFGGRTSSLTTELGFYRIESLPVEAKDWIMRHDYRGRF